VRAWPTTAEELIREQEGLACATPPLWRATGEPAVGGCFVCFVRGKRVAGEAGDPGWADVLLVNATGRDHPRRAGLALDLGAVLDLPPVGISHRLLLADGEWPADEAGATSPFRLEGEQVGHWLRTRRGTRTGSSPL
jgi:deoxyribonuclease V